MDFIALKTSFLLAIISAKSLGELEINLNCICWWPDDSGVTIWLNPSLHPKVMSPKFVNQVINLWLTVFYQDQPAQCSTVSSMCLKILLPYSKGWKLSPIIRGKHHGLEEYAEGYAALGGLYCSFLGYHHVPSPGSVKSTSPPPLNTVISKHHFLAGIGEFIPHGLVA